MFNSSPGCGTKVMEANDDGLFDRFLISVDFKRKPNRDFPVPDNKLPKLTHLFYCTCHLHKEEKEYRFNTDGISFWFICLSDFFYRY